MIKQNLNLVLIDMNAIKINLTSLINIEMINKLKYPDCYIDIICSSNKLADAWSHDIDIMCTNYGDILKSSGEFMFTSSIFLLNYNNHRMINNRLW